MGLLALVAVVAGPVAPASAAPAGVAAIDQRYAETGGEAGPLGPSTGATACSDAAPSGCFHAYRDGYLYWSAATGARYTLAGAVRFAWLGTSGQLGPLGYPVTDLFCGLRGGGCGQHFQGGSVYSRPGATLYEGAFVLGLGMRDAWGRAGWENGPLGYPTGPAECNLRGGGCVQRFDGGLTYQQAGQPAHAVHGAILGRYSAAGWENGLGFPTSDPICGLRDGGCGQHFEGGSIYTSAGSPAVVVPVGPWLDRWAATGWENGPWGYPVSDRFCGLRGSYCGQHFQGGSLYAVPTSGAGLFGGFVQGAIRQYWSGQGWENGPLAGPRGDEFCGLRSGGCGQHFVGGSVYWSPSTGAHGVSGPVHDRWAQQRWEQGPLGLPVVEMFCGLRDAGCGQHFQGGSVYDSSSTPPTVVPAGPIRDTWAAAGWENGRYGYPRGEQYPVPGGWAQSFQGGTITYAYGRVR